MRNLEIESWIWYSFAVGVAICRLISRSLLFGSPLRIKIDDWLIVFAIATYTALVVCMNIVADKSSNLIPPGVDVHDFTSQEVHERVVGSKLVVVVEQMQCLTIWTLKATLIIMYYRITYQLPQNLYVKILAVYVAGNFVVMEILYFAVWCRPFHDYWAVPTPNKQCDAATDHLITNAVFNLSSDLIMLVIGFSMALKSRLPWKRRIIVHAIFALGIFVIVAAVLNKYYSFSEPYGSLWTFWYIREASTAMIVANLPYTWTLIRRVFNVGSFSGESDTSDVKYHSSRTARGRRTATPSNAATIQGQNLSTKNSSGSESHNDSSFDQLRSRTASPTVERQMEPFKPVRKTWRDKGVFGREDAELFKSDDELNIDLEAQEARQRASDAVQGPSCADAHEDMILNDVGSLGTTPAPLPTQSKSAHSRHASHGSSGRQSPELRRPPSRSGAPEDFGRSVAAMKRRSQEYSSAQSRSKPKTKDSG